MRWETVKGIAERVLVAAFMYATGKGWVAPEAAAGYVALILGILQAIWGWYQNTPGVLINATAALPPERLAELPTKSLLIATAALPQVDKVELKPTETALAAAVPSPKVEAK